MEKLGHDIPSDVSGTTDGGDVTGETKSIDHGLLELMIAVEDSSHGDRKRRARRHIAGIGVEELRTGGYPALAAEVEGWDPESYKKDPYEDDRVLRQLTGGW